MRYVLKKIYEKVLIDLLQPKSAKFLFLFCNETILRYYAMQPRSAECFTFLYKTSSQTRLMFFYIKQVSSRHKILGKAGMSLFPISISFCFGGHSRVSLKFLFTCENLLSVAIFAKKESLKQKQKKTTIRVKSNKISKMKIEMNKASPKDRFNCGN